VESRARHGYEIGKLIEERSKGALRLHVASLDPRLYRLEKRGWIQGRWVEKAGQRRRRYYRLTAQGSKILAAQKRGWELFVEAIQRITNMPDWRREIERRLAGLPLAPEREAEIVEGIVRSGPDGGRGATDCHGRNQR
jgi:DNA-binding PadR family transcriptional regulator